MRPKIDLFAHRFLTDVGCFFFSYRRIWRFTWPDDTFSPKCTLTNKQTMLFSTFYAPWHKRDIKYAICFAFVHRIPPQAKTITDTAVINTSWPTDTSDVWRKGNLLVTSHSWMNRSKPGNSLCKKTLPCKQPDVYIQIIALSTSQRRIQ